MSHGSRLPAAAPMMVATADPMGIRAFTSDEQAEAELYAAEVSGSVEPLP